jgi:hypothetical protein
MHRTQNPTAPAADTIDDSTVVVTPADILRGAATYLETHGWTQGSYYGTPRPFPCADVTGALGMSAHGMITDCPSLDGPNVRDCNHAFTYLTGYLIDQGHVSTTGDHWDITPASAGEWNDRDDQSAANVIATLRAAADDYDWHHATEDDLETYGEACYATEKLPTREGFLAWLGAR